MGALVHDLGRPARFVNMLRMFKVTSPMSLGHRRRVCCGPTRPPEPCRLDAVRGTTAGWFGRHPVRVFEAGWASVSDPKYTVGPQREGLSQRGEPTPRPLTA
jgi:hypothetical protein